MAWQEQLVRDIVGWLPQGAVVEVVGSVESRVLVDAWSDLDLHLRLPQPLELTDLVGGATIWAAEATDAPEGQVVRVVLADGRRLDIVVELGRLVLPTLARDNDVRFLAAQAVSKLGRHDRLIGGHLVLELLQACLVEAMLLRDQDEGSQIHRAGTARDALAAEVLQWARLPLAVDVHPNVVEQVVGLYGEWRHEREPDYEPDWSGLLAVLRRRLGVSAHTSGSCEREDQRG